MDGTQHLSIASVTQARAKHFVGQSGPLPWLMGVYSDRSYSLETFPCLGGSKNWELEVDPSVKSDPDSVCRGCLLLRK